MNELALIKSRSLRAEYANRVEVLDKVKAQAIGGVYMALGLFARCEELRRVDRADEVSAPN